jgi:cell division septum initiation protein DivIVA
MSTSHINFKLNSHEIANLIICGSQHYKMEDEYSTDTDEFLAKVISKLERYAATIRKLEAENFRLREKLALFEGQQNKDCQEIEHNEEQKLTPRRSDRIEALTKTTPRTGKKKASPRHALLRSAARKAAPK